MSVLVLAEHDNKELKPSTLSAITAASKIHENIDVNISKSKIIENPGQLGLYPGDFMEGY